MLSNAASTNSFFCRKQPPQFPMTLRTFQDIITNKSSVRSVPNAPPISKKTVTKRHIFNAHIVSPSETSHVSDTRPQKTQAALKKAEKQAKIVAARNSSQTQIQAVKNDKDCAEQDSFSHTLYSSQKNAQYNHGRRCCRTI